MKKIEQGCKLSSKTEFCVHEDFMDSLKVLFQKSGPGKRAGERTFEAYSRAQSGNYSHEAVFKGFPLTNHGEDRIAHCIKYDLTGYARLITAFSNNICIFLFAGDHDTASAWLEKNRGMDFVARHEGKTNRLSTVYVSDRKQGVKGLIESVPDFQSNGPVINLLNESYREKILGDLDQDIIDDIMLIESHTDDSRVLDIVERVADEDRRDVILDVLLELKSSDKIKAKNRIDKYIGAVKAISELSDSEVKQLASSESIVRIEDINPELFEHFVKTADYKKWMLFLHPSQRSIVDRDFSGPTRLAGVSGSGKTCVVIHRAVRLARAEPEKQVLVLTLNDALAKLIEELIKAQCGETLPSNIEIKSIFQLCYEMLTTLEPTKTDYYKRRTVAKNTFVSSEHIDEIWDEYFRCQNNNIDANQMLEVVRTLLVRNVSPQDYLRQELDYVRSAFSPKERTSYLDMERYGRVIPFEQRYRRMVLAGLKGWETKMAIVGAIDDLGIVTALYRHLASLKPTYHHVLVDEMQDLGTLELQIIRRITFPGPNDLLLCGDAAQAVQTKHADFKAAGIDIPPARSISLKQNYRNSTQILTAAYNVLTRSFDKIPKGTVDLEILPPEYANFSSPKPALLKADSIKDELGFALAYAKDLITPGSGRKACIAMCGYTQRAIEELGHALEVDVLSETTDISHGHIFLSDLEQTKGFEFDLMMVLNCSTGAIPHPQLPEHEWFRDLCKLYVALTRAKTELVVSYSGASSVFIDDSLAYFNADAWSAYGITPLNLNDLAMPIAAMSSMGDTSEWQVNGKDFLKLRDAIGLSQSAQDAILKCVTGTAKVERRAIGGQKQTEWKTFAEFYLDMQNPRNAVSIISPEVLDELNEKFAKYLEDLGKPNLQSEGTPSSSPASPQANLPKTKTSTDIKVVKEETALRFFRHSKVTSYSVETRSAYMLAVLLAAQQVPEVEKLEVGKPMSKAVLDFLLPDVALRDWQVREWMRPHKASELSFALTKLGWDECLARIGKGNKAVRVSDSKLVVDIKRVEAFRQTICHGPTVANQMGNYSSKSFPI